MNQSESIANLSAALVKAQAEMSGAVKDSANPFFKSKYADLEAVIKAIKEPFAKNNLAYTQFPYTDEKGVGVVTRLIHSSGEWIECGYTLPLTKLDPQAAGSAITYARRYALQAMAGIPAVDDDAEMAMARTPKTVGGKLTRHQAPPLTELLATPQADARQHIANVHQSDSDSTVASSLD